MRKIVAIAVAGCIAATILVVVLSSPTGGHPKVSAAGTTPSSRISDSSHRPVLLRWSDISVGGQTGFYITVNGSQVADVPSSPYRLADLPCGTTSALGVEAHDRAGKRGRLYTTRYTAPACPPVNTVAPYFCGVASGVPGCAGVSGDAVVGQTLTVGEGTWANSPGSYTYQWKGCTTSDGPPPRTGACSPIPGATSSSYTVRAADAGTALVPIVTAHNGSSASTTVSGSCRAGSTPGGSIGTRGTNIYPDPVEPPGCSPISAVAATSQAGERLCTNAPVTCGFPDPLAGTAGVPPGTSLTTRKSLTCTSGTVSGVYVVGSVTLGGTCTLKNSRVIVPAGGLNLQNYSNLTLIDDEFAGAYSGASSATTGTGEAANVSAQCTYSYSSGTSNSYDLVFDGSLRAAHLSRDYFHCAVEPLNGHAGITDSYLISDEAGSTTHNEAIYSPGGDGYVFRNDVILNPWSQTAGLYTDCKLHGPPNGARVVGNLAATYGSNGALGVQDGSDSGCGSPTPSNITVAQNRYAYVYSASMPCGYANGVGVTFGGNIADDTGKSMGSKCGG